MNPVIKTRSATAAQTPAKMYVVDENFPFAASLPFWIGALSVSAGAVDKGGVDGVDVGSRLEGISDEGLTCGFREGFGDGARLGFVVGGLVVNVATSREATIPDVPA
jgi:hypothetical protein